MSHVEDTTEQAERTRPGSENPVIPPVLVEHLPPAMKQYGHYVAWRFDYDDEAADPTKRRRKEPKRANGDCSRNAMSNEPATWAEYRAALAAYQAAYATEPGVVGLGFVFAKLNAKHKHVLQRHADEFVFVDLDHCRDPETGEIEGWAWDIIRRFNTYAEASPSGTGVHLYLRGELARAYKVGDIEVYADGRFTTLTGAHVDETPDDVQPAQEALDWLVKRLAKDTPGTLNGRYADTRDIFTRRFTPVRAKDPEILERIRHSNQGEKFIRLYDDGDYSDRPSQSEAVQALVCILAWWTRKDAERVDRLFRESALCNGKWSTKWDDPRGDVTLGICEMATAFAFVETVYEEPTGKATAPQVARLTTVRASDVIEKPLRWAWPQYVPLGKATLLDGEPDKGKSQVTVDLLARWTSGRPMPDGSVSQMGGPVDVVLMSCEDDPEDTIVPRLRLAGADLNRVHLILNVQLTDGTTELPTIPRDVPLLRAKIEETGSWAFVVDPLVGYLDGRVDTHNDASIRRALNTLHAVAQTTSSAGVGIRHFNKDSKETNPLHRGGGSIGIIGFARAALAIVPDPDPHSELRYLGVSKHNLGPIGTPTMVYQIVPVETTIQGERVELSRVEWCGTDPRDIRTLLSAAATSPTDGTDDGPRGALAACFTFLEEYLGDGEWHASTAVQAAALAAGHSDRTMVRCTGQWTKAGTLERRKQPAKKDAHTRIETPAYWEMRLMVLQGGAHG